MSYDVFCLKKQIMINAIPRTVVGIMGDGIQFPDSPDGYAKLKVYLWIENTTKTTRTKQQRGIKNIVIVGRVSIGLTRAQINLFFVAETATTKIYSLSLHDALPISPQRASARGPAWV